MKNWTEGDVRHMLSARDEVNIAKLAEVCYDADFLRFANYKGDVLIGMVERRRQSNFPGFTMKQTPFAASILANPVNSGLVYNIVHRLNHLESRGNPIVFRDVVEAARPKKPVVSKEQLQREALRIAALSVSHESPKQNAEWGIF